MGLLGSLWNNNAEDCEGGIGELSSDAFVGGQKNKARSVAIAHSAVLMQDGGRRRSNLPALHASLHLFALAVPCLYGVFSLALTPP